MSAAAANIKTETCTDTMSWSSASACADERVADMAERRWHPALRALTIVALGAAAWVPIVATGRLILS
ncbi:MAG: hypothetical protein ABW128_08385 [Rhizorhabdus sp.]